MRLPTLGRRPDDEAVSRPAIFVIGVARSGTTLLRLMLDAHPELAIPPETHFIPQVIKAADGADDPAAAMLEVITTHRRWPDFQLDEAELRERFDGLENPEPGPALREFYGLYAGKHGATRWGDKSTNYVRKMRPISRVLPEARFVHLIRDGRDVALSLVDVHFGPSHVAEAAEKWSSEIAKARRQGKRIGNYTEIRYEDLIADPEPVLRTICDATDLPWDDAMLNYQERAGERIGEIIRDFDRSGGDTVSAETRAQHQANVSKPLQSSRAARWKTDMSPEDLATFESIAGEMLDELGYERGSG